MRIEWVPWTRKIISSIIPIEEAMEREEKGSEQEIKHKNYY